MINHNANEINVKKNLSPWESWIAARTLLQTILREWAGGLSHVELRAVLFVFDRTVLWGKQWERVTLRQCRDGVWCYATGNQIAAPWTSTEVTALKTLKALVERGVLLRESNANGQKIQYSINIEYTMKLPKNMSKPPIAARGGERKTTHSGYGLKNRIKKEITDKDSSPTEILDRVRRDFASGQKAKQAKQRLVPDSQTKIKILWASLAQRYSAASGTLNSVEAKLVKGLWWQFLTHFPGQSFPEFLEWLFSEWLAIRADKFGWMTDCPDYLPSRFVTSKKLQILLLEAWRHKAQIEKAATMTPRERASERMRSQGITPETIQRDRAEKDHEWEAIERAKRELAAKQAAEGRRIQEVARKVGQARRKIRQQERQVLEDSGGSDGGKVLPEFEPWKDRD